ncbi:hypothetical protein [Spiroplasma kunkelii]|nr:hypothetical protein [Spiroplasma kunkelii]
MFKFIYFSILSWNDKDFLHFVFVIIMSVFAFMGIIFVIIMYIKYIFEIKLEFDVELVRNLYPLQQKKQVLLIYPIIIAILVFDWVISLFIRVKKIVIK